MSKLVTSMPDEPLVFLNRTLERKICRQVILNSYVMVCCMLHIQHEALCGFCIIPLIGHVEIMK